MSERMRNLLSLLIAAIAVLLSQFPPVYQWFETANLQIKIERKFVLSSDIFRAPSINKHYSVTNIGKAPGRIKSLRLFITSSNGDVLYETSAQAYRLRSLGPFDRHKWEEFSEIGLNPSRNWSHLVSFGRPLNNPALEEIQAIQSEINEKRDEWKYRMEDEGHRVDSLDYDGPDFVLPEKYSERLSAIAKKNIPWLQEGGYRLYEVTLSGDDGRKSMGYNFKIQKQHIRQFSRSLDRRLSSLDYGYTPFVVFEIYPNEEGLPKSVEKRLAESGDSSHY